MTGEQLRQALQSLANALERRTREEVDAAWEAAWALPETRDAHRSAPAQLKAIVEAARKRSEGFFVSESGYREVVGKIIEAAAKGLI